MIKRGIGRVFIAMAAFSALGCMSYNGFQPKYIDPPRQRVINSADTLYYNVTGSALFAGPNSIRNVLTAESAFSASAPRESAPGRGTFIDVRIEQLPPSMAAVVFGYISYATFTILPFWSTQDGSLLRFTLYRDGQIAGSEERVLGRKTFVWAAMLPFVWVNLLTPDEEEAFAATTREVLAKYQL